MTNVMSFGVTRGSRLRNRNKLQKFRFMADFSCKLTYSQKSVDNYCCFYIVKYDIIVDVNSF